MECLVVEYPAFLGGRRLMGRAFTYSTTGQTDTGGLLCSNPPCVQAAEHLCIVHFNPYFRISSNLSSNYAKNRLNPCRCKCEWIKNLKYNWLKCCLEIPPTKFDTHPTKQQQCSSRKNCLCYYNEDLKVSRGYFEICSPAG
jgi:hypothetical protein